MSSSPRGIRLAPLPPAWGPVPVVAAPAASTTTDSADQRPAEPQGTPAPRQRSPARPVPGPRVSTTATASRAMPTMKWVMTT